MTKKCTEQEDLFIKTLFTRGVNTRARVISFNEDIEDGHFEYLDCALSLLESHSTEEPITLRLACYGGSTYEFAAMVDRLRSSPCRIDVDCFGYAMSAAGWILACGATGKRRISKNSWFMFHTCNYALPRDSHAVHRRYIRQVDLEMDKLCQLMADHTKKPKSFWSGLVKSGQDHYFSAEETVELGVADEVI
jgi:ATP-dependent Clp protease protease subunit